MVLFERQRSDLSRSAKTICPSPWAVWKNKDDYSIRINPMQYPDTWVEIITYKLENLPVCWERDCSPLLWSYSLNATALKDEKSKTNMSIPQHTWEEDEWTWGKQFIDAIFSDEAVLGWNTQSDRKDSLLKSITPFRLRSNKSKICHI